MLRQFIVLCGFQLAGEALVGATGSMIPGPLVGMLLLLAWLRARGGASEGLDRAAGLLLDHLGLYFIPAGAGIVAYATLIARDGLALAAALLISVTMSILFASLLASRPWAAGDVESEPEAT